jgi:hypothetical protein
MIKIPDWIARMTILIPPLGMNTLRMNHVHHNPRKISAVPGAMGMNAEFKEARTGLLTSQPEIARRLRNKTNPMNMSA